MLTIYLRDTKDLLIKDFRSEISEFQDKIVEQILRPT